MADLTPDLSSDSSLLSSLWQVHQSAEWPVAGDVHEGELMTLDTVVAGCVTYYVEEHGLDTQRVGILKDCLADLENLLPDLEPDDPQAYFERLQQLGDLLLKLTLVV
ncbi:MAG: hypothetical protein IH978_00245 [Nitrospinae bacterium]|nr:hypothetical protein [Nitrospinota bacterium]